jgi:tetratricopeptide (TPR) repeat protein
MKNRTKAVTAHIEFPMRKLVVGMMAVAIAAIFLTSFFTGANVPLERQAGAKKSMKSDEMSAVPALMARIKDNPKDEEAVLELAEIFSRAQDWQKSEFFWSKATEIDPSNLGARYHRGFTRVQLKRYEEAIADYEFILQAKPDAYQAHYYLGVINKYGLDKPDVAKRYFQQALAAKPQDRELVAEIEKELSDMK